MLYPPDNKLIGNFIAAGACGFAFDVVGEPNMVIKVCRLVDYESIIPHSISDFGATQQSKYKNMDFSGGIALNEFQAILFSQLYNMQKTGEEITPHLPKVYGFSSGEMWPELMEEITNSYDFYNWSPSRYNTIVQNFIPRFWGVNEGKVIPGTRIGLWIMERLEGADAYDKTDEDENKARKQVVALNKWLRKHNYIVRDTKNQGNWGFRKGTDEIVWFDPGVSPWPIKQEWKDDEDVQLRNMFYLFLGGFGSISKYDKMLEDVDRYDEMWHQAETKE